MILVVHESKSRKAEKALAKLAEEYKIIGSVVKASKKMARVVYA